MKFAHTALSVRNLEESRKFYETVFNLKLSVEGKREELGIRFISLTDKKGNAIELIQHKNPVPLAEDLMDFERVGIKHVGFEVENIEEVIERAKKLGAKVLWEPRKGVTVKRVAFVSDPDGIPIELVEA
ncbi:MAG TPA: VOC family protein [Candidatus Paceibacterota bacterium]